MGGKSHLKQDPQYFKKLAAKRFKGMSKEEKSVYMKKVRNGQSPLI